MRILYSHRIQSHDGQGVHVQELVAAFRALGHEVRVVGPGFYQAAGFGGESRAVARLRRLLPGPLLELAEIAYAVPAYRRLARACAEFGPDLLYERYNLFHLAGAVLARRRKLLFYLEVNAPIADERSRFGNLRLQRLAHRAERFVWQAARRVLVVTGVLGDIVAATGVPRERIEVTQNGIDPARFAEPVVHDGGAVVLGFVGFMRAWHGLAAVIEAIAREDDARFRLTIVGDGPVRAELEAQAEGLGLAERVTFTGLAQPEAIPALIASFDIALQPKVVAYASPLKIFEYMAAGRAIVAPDQPNIREILEHDRTALLFDPADPGAMWGAVRRLADEPALRNRLGAAARAEITARDYTWHGNARRIIKWAAADSNP